MIGPRAATGGFPYPHRTVAEVWDEQRRERELYRDPGAGTVVHLTGGSASTLPASPCPRCESRGWCGHRSAAA